MEFHPIAGIFPLLPEHELEALAESIQSQGLLHPIRLFEGKILDGRNRYRACDRAGVKPSFEDFGGSALEAVELVWAENETRRHLTSAQRAAAGKMREEAVAEIGAAVRRIEEEARERVKEGGRQGGKVQPGSAKPAPKARQSIAEPSGAASRNDPDLRTDAVRAKLYGTNRTTLRDVDKLHDRRPDLFEKVHDGSLTLPAAKRELKREEVREKLEAVTAREVVEPTGEYDVIVIDPPWPMEKIERDERPNQVDFDYPTMTEAEIGALKIPAAEDCHLWLWTTHRFLPMAFRLLGQWSMKYVCTFVWHKPGGFQPVGLPQYNCEFALYARKGSPIFLDTKSLPTCFQAPRGKHSEKPEEFYETVRRVTGGRRLDMFSRRKIDGFDGWGNEA